MKTIFMLNHIKRKNFFLVLFFVLFILTSYSQRSIREFFFKEIDSNLVSKKNTYEIDTINKINLVFFSPITNSKLTNWIINRDKYKCINDSNKYEGAEVRYNICSSSDKFNSILKSVYIQDEGIPRGFYTWEESLNYFLFNDTLYEISYFFSDSIKIGELIKKGLLDADCEKIKLKNKNELLFYFKKNKLYIHNPIDSDFCNSDIEYNYKKNKLFFSVVGVLHQ